LPVPGPAAEEDDDVAITVVGEGVVESGRGAGAHLGIGCHVDPLRAVPFPGIVALTAAAVSAEEDDAFPLRVAGKCVTVPGRGVGCGFEVHPLGAIEEPRICNVAGVVRAPKEEHAAVDVVICQRVLRAKAGRSDRPPERGNGGFGRRV